MFINLIRLKKINSYVVLLNNVNVLVKNFIMFIQMNLNLFSLIVYVCNKVCYLNVFLFIIGNIYYQLVIIFVVVFGFGMVYVIKKKIVYFCSFFIYIMQ